MALAEATNHAASRRQKPVSAIREEVEHATHCGPRAQKTPPGERPGILAEPGPQRSDRTVRRSSGEAHPPLTCLHWLRPSLGYFRGEAKKQVQEDWKARQAKEQEEQRQAGLEEEAEDPDGWQQALTVSSTAGTVARDERSGLFHPLLRRREGKGGRKRNFLEDTSLVAALVVDTGSGLLLAGLLAGLSFQASWLIWT